MRGGRVRLLRVPDAAGRSGDKELAEEADAGAETTTVLHLRWKPLGNAEEEDAFDDGAAGVDPASVEQQLVAAARGSLAVWSLPSATDSCELRPVSHWMLPAASEGAAAVFDPHHEHVVLAAAGTGIWVWDTRQAKGQCSVSAAHQGRRVLDISANPNRPWFVSTAGEDGTVRCWDLRISAPSTTAAAGGVAVATPEAGAADSGAVPANEASCLLTLRGHSHWALQSAFNPFHDQLVASSGTDGSVVLWRASSISSAPILEEPDMLLASDGADSDEATESGSGATSERKVATGRTAPDAAVRRWVDHSDSVYALAWSATNAWTLATLSYGGSFIIYEVPAAEKYKILL